MRAIASAPASPSCRPLPFGFGSSVEHVLS
jgi:hypothetical protein